MTQTATKSFSMITASAAQQLDVSESWKIVDTEAAVAEYAPIAELHCADLALMPIFLTVEQATAIEAIMSDPNSGPRSAPRLLPMRD